MITAEEVRRARGKMSRKAFSGLTGISEAKIAGLEKGRRITNEEEAAIQPFLDQAASDTTDYRMPPPERKARSNGSAAASRENYPPPSPVGVMPTKDDDVVLLEFGIEGEDPLDDLDMPIELEPLPVAPVPVPPPLPPAEDVAERLKPTLPEVPEGARLVSNSEIQTFKRCPRKWYLSFVRGMRPKTVSPNGALQIGTRAHAALAQWYVPDGDDRTDPRDALERILVEDWTKIVESTGEDEQRLRAYATDFKADSDLLRAMLAGYMQWLEETGADEDLEVVAPEAPMVAPLPMESETPVFITGRMDVRARRRSDGARLFMDHKTVADLTGPARVLHMNPQMMHYHLLEILDMERERIEAGDDVHYEIERTDGALYNMIRKVKRAVTAKPPFYQRIEVRHNKHEISAYAHQLRGIVRAMLAAQTQLDAGYDLNEVVYPTPNDTCAWSCDFFIVCPMMNDGSRWEQFLENNFQVTDPYDRYPELR